MINKEIERPCRYSLFWIRVSSLILAIVVITSYTSVDWIVDSYQWVNHTHQVVSEILYTRNLIGDSQSSVRVYVITKNLNHLRPYYESQSQIDPAIAKLRFLTVDNPIQQNYINKLEQDVKRKRQFLSDVVENLNSGNEEKAINLIKSGVGIVLMDDISAITNNMREVEVGLLRKRVDQSGQLARVTMLGMPFLLIINLVIINLAVKPSY